MLTPHAHVVVRVEARVHGHDGGGRAAAGEHPDQDQVGVVDPVEGVVGARPGDARAPQQLQAPRGPRQVRPQRVVGVLARVHVRHGRLGRRRVRAHFDAVAVVCRPVRAL